MSNKCNDNNVTRQITIQENISGRNGLSAYEIAIKEGEIPYDWTEKQFIESLKGETGSQGIQGIPGVSITDINKVNDELVISKSNGESINVGNIKGDKGDQGDPLPYSEWSPEDVDKLIEDVNINAQRIPAITAGVLPTPPQANMYMVVTDVGPYTYGGTTIGTNTEGYQTTFWWNGTAWSNNGSVKVFGEDENKADIITPEGKVMRAPLVESEETWTELVGTNFGDGSGYYAYNTGILSASTVRKRQLWSISDSDDVYLTGIIDGSSAIAIAVYFDASMVYLGYQQRVETGTLNLTRQKLIIPSGTAYVGSGNTNARTPLKLESKESNSTYKEPIFKDEVYNKIESDNKFDTSTTIDITTESTNIADISKAVSGMLVQSALNAGINKNSTLPDWHVLFLPIDNSETHIAIQGWNSVRNEIYWGKGVPPTSADEISLAWSTDPVRFIQSGHSSTLGYGTKSGGRIILPIPADATWFALTLKSNADGAGVYNNFMINYGNSYDDYAPYPTTISVVSKINTNDVGARKLIDADDKLIAVEDLALKSDIPQITGKAKVDLYIDNSIPSRIEYQYKGKSVVQTIRPFRNHGFSNSQTFEFEKVYVNSIEVGSTNDDGTPYRLNNTTLGGNHGYAKSVVTIAGHGKTHADIGSVWSDGTSQYVLSDINNNVLYFISVLGNTIISGSTLTHVSGATNTSNINSTTKTNAQLFNSIGNINKRVFIDGEELLLTANTTLYYNKELTFVESYDILNKDSIVQYLIDNVGTFTPADSPILLEGSSDVRVTNTFRFDTEMGCTQYQDFLSLKDGIPFQDIMFIQAQYNNIDAPVKYYIPKTLPITYNGNSYDFSNIVNMTSFNFVSTSDGLNFTNALSEPTGLKPDRVVRLHNSIGFAVGFIPVRTNSPENRPINATRKYLQIRGTKKIYMSSVDISGKTMLAKGEYYSSIGYRKYFELKSARTAYYTIDTTEGTYLYADWHSAILDTLVLKDSLIGKSYEVVEKSDSVNILSEYATDRINIDVTGKGYLILKFN